MVKKQNGIKDKYKERFLLKEKRIMGKMILLV